MDDHRIVFPSAKRKTKTRKIPSQASQAQDGGALNLAGAARQSGGALRLAGQQGRGLALDILFEFLKCIAKWLFSTRTSKAKDQAKALPEVKNMLTDCAKILAEHNITDSKTWRQWALKNHPDKGGDSDLFAKVSDCVDKNIKSISQQGSGILDKLISLMKLAGVKGLDKMFAGEIHVPHRTPGGLVMANFAGPGTQLEKRLARGDLPVSNTDAIAMKHDIRYSLAKTPADIRAADKELLDSLAAMRDYAFNKDIAMAGIKAKYAAEGAAGVLFPGAAELQRNDANDAMLLSKLQLAESEIKRRQQTGGGLRMAGGRAAKRMRGRGISFKGLLAGVTRLADSANASLDALGVKPAVHAAAKKAATDVQTKMLAELANRGASAKQLELAQKGSLAVGKALAKKVGIAGSGLHMAGSGFWDSLLSIVSWLPIPVISDVARIYSATRVAVSTAQGKPINKVLGGVVTSLGDVVSKIPVVGAVVSPANEALKMTGFGVEQAQSSADVAKAAELVKVSGDNLRDVLALVPADPAMPAEAKKFIGELSAAAAEMSAAGEAISASSAASSATQGSGFFDKGYADDLLRKIRSNEAHDLATAANINRMRAAEALRSKKK